MIVALLSRTPRVEQRRNWTNEIRLELSERDLDEFEDKFAELDGKLSKIMAVCVSILVSLVTASVLLALNLALGG